MSGPEESWENAAFDTSEVGSFIRDRIARDDDRRRLRLENLIAPENRPTEDSLRKLDSSLKKCTTYIRKLKNATEAQRDVLLRDFTPLNLSKYVGEIASSLVEAKLKMNDITSFAVELCSKAHGRYTEFSKCLLDEWKKVFPRKKTDTIANPSKLRVDLRFFSELILVGVFGEEEALPILGSVLGFLVNKDKETHSNIAILLSFCKFSGDAYADIVPRKMRVLAEEAHVEIPGSDLIPKDKQKNVNALLVDYYESLVKRAVRDCKTLRNMERNNQRALLTRGEVHPETAARYEEAKVNFEKLWSNCEAMADYLDKDLPELPAALPPEEDAIMDELGISGMGSEQAGGFTIASVWEDEDAQNFYECLPELKQMLPGILFHESLEPTLEPLKDEILEEDEEELAEGEAQENDQEQDAPTTGPTTEEPQEEVSRDPTPEDTTEQEPETEDSSVEHGTMKILLKDFLEGLPNTINRDLIDKAAIDFTTHLNTAGNRKKLVKALYGVHRNRLDLLPFYARLVAVLNPIMPDVGTELVQDLIGGFRREVRLKNQLHMETKIKIVRFIGELVKFRIFPKSEALHCLKMLLFDFRHHNIDMCCSLLDVCGYFLYHSPDSHHKTKFLIESMMKKKQSSHLDPRYQLMVDNAYFSCNPPSGDIQRKQIPPLHTFIQKLLYENIEEDEVETSLKLLRKLDWTDTALCDYCVRCCSRPWKVRFDLVHSLASLVSGVSYYYDDVAVAVVDNVLEDVRSGMEINDPKFNQRRVASIRYLGELYNYRVIDSSIIFGVLYSLISFGVMCDATSKALVPSAVDPPEHLFRIRLVCSLLETCGHYFDRGSSKKKLDCFLAYFQRYYWLKRSQSGVWDAERRPFPLDVENVLKDTMEILRSGKAGKPFKDLAEAQAAVEAVEEELKAKVEAALKLENDTEYGKGLCTIAEDDDEEVSSGESDGGGAGDEGRGSSSDERRVWYSEEEESEMHFLRKTHQPARCKEDEEFLSAFDKMMAESVQSRMSEASKVPQADFTVPVGLQKKMKLRFADSPPVEDEETPENSDPKPNVTVFSFMTRGKGNKPALKTLKVPETSELALSVRSRERELQREKEQMKKLTLNMTERMQEEEQVQAANELQQSLWAAQSRRPGFQHPKGAPNTRQIFRDNWH